MRSTNSALLERWLGAEKCEELSYNMRGWYGPPIALHGVPGAVYATGDGDFVGEIRAGFETNYMDRAIDLARRLKRAARVATGIQKQRLNAGFTSVGDLINEATVGGKRQTLSFNKVGVAGAATATNTLWPSGTVPAAGGVGPAWASPAVCSSATVGALPFTNPAPGDTTYVVSTVTASSAASHALLLVDRLIHASPSLLVTTLQSNTMTPPRHTSGVGNFMSLETTTVLAATAHNITIAANSGASTSTFAGRASATAGSMDMLLGHWFCPINSGNTITNVTGFTTNVAVATGAVTLSINHPKAWMTHPVANMYVVIDGVSTAFNLVRVEDNACLSFIEPVKPAATATTYTGQIVLVSG
jgi:hypothetical protein